MSDHKENLFQIAVQNVYRDWGKAFEKLGKDTRRALLTEKCFLLLSGMDDATEALSVVALLDYFHARIIETFEG